MHDFWISTGGLFVFIEFIVIVFVCFTSMFYTGSVKKLELIIRDIKILGEPTNETLLFDKFFYNKNRDPTNISTFTHIFYKIPSIKKEPKLYENIYFLRQLSRVKVYRFIYKWLFIFLLINALIIIVMSYLYGTG